MNAVAFTGRAAEVRWGYQPAAQLASWAITADARGGGVLTATVLDSDAFRVSQQPLTFAVPRPNGHDWIWPIVSLQIAGSTLQASLAPQE